MSRDKPHPADLFIDAIAEAVVAKIQGIGSVPRLMSLKSAAEYLSMSEKGLREAAANRKLPVIRTDRFIRFDRKDLDRYIEDHRV